MANGSLTLGGNSSITLGSEAAPATLNIGWSQNTNAGGGALGNATGVLDATEGSFTADLSILRIGQNSTQGSGTGEFIMGNGASVNANVVNVGMDANANGTLTVIGDNLTFTGDETALNFGTGVLEVPAGAFTLGSAATPLSALRIGYNPLGTGAADTTIDLTMTNPIFTAFIADDLSIGRETGANNFASPVANGSLTLGGNSSITLGSEAAPATLNIGWSQNTNAGGGALGNATGVLDVLENDADLDLNLSELNVGRGRSSGFGTGTLKWDQTEVIAASTIIFGRGNATGILEVPEDGEIHLGTDTDPISFLAIAYNDAGTGTATADLDFSVTNPIFTAFIADDLSISRETGANNFASPVANGSLTLGGNSSITLGSEAAPATLNIGWSQNNQRRRQAPWVTPPGYSMLLENDADLDLNLSELNVGRGRSSGFANGNAQVGSDGSHRSFRPSSSGAAMPPVSWRFRKMAKSNLGTDTDPISFLADCLQRCGHRCAATADLDFSVTNPIFTAFIARRSFHWPGDPGRTILPHLWRTAA